MNWYLEPAPQLSAPPRERRFSVAHRAEPPSPLHADLAERRLALAVDAARLGAWTWDMRTATTTWDARLEAMHGLVTGTFGGTFEDWLATIHPEDREASLTTVADALAHPGPYALLHRTIWPDGSVHTIECRGMVLVEDGRPIGTTGVAIDVTSREQLVQTLQRALLPVKLPTVPGVEVATRYRAAETRSDIGGDWYAVIALNDTRLGVAIGDVAGHGLDAVADMAAARFSLRALALNESRPEVVLEQLNEVVKVFEGDAMITALYGVLDTRAATWTYASAGHVPAVMRRADGRSRLLDATPDPPLGVGVSYRARVVPLTRGSTLVLYTDGLVERRGEPLLTCIGRLADACAAGPPDADALCDHIVHALLDAQPNEDDVAVVALAFR